MESDVAIIGGGPAGAGAAIRLRQLGVRVLVLEKDRFPREKLCGEFVSPEVRRLAQELGISTALAEAAPATIHRARLHLYDAGPWMIDLPEPALGISRTRLDEILLRRAASAGAEVREQVAAELVKGDSGGGFVVTFRQNGRTGEIRTRALICAAGRWNRLTGPMAEGNGRSTGGRAAFGFKAHFEADIAAPGTLDLFFFPGGYCGISAIEGGRANVCCLVEKRHLQRGRAAGKDPSAVLLNQPGLAGRLSRGRRLTEFLFTGPLQFGTPRPTENGMFLVGDSAAFIDPFCGDGISIAIHSGILAAETAEEFLAGRCDLEDALQRYARNYQQAFRRQFAWARRLRALAKFQPVAKLAARAAEFNPWLGKRLFRDTRPDWAQ